MTDRVMIPLFSFPLAEVTVACKHSCPVNHANVRGRACLKPGQSCDCVFYGQPLREDLTEEVLGGADPATFLTDTPLDGLDKIVTDIL